MAITAQNNSTPRELIPAANYIARCYQMIHIGTVSELYKGENRLTNKVRIGWELPTEKKVFKEERGEEPLVISQTYTLSLGEKSFLRRDLKSWRGKDFNEEELKAFDITKLVGVPCMLNIIHIQGKKDPSKTYESIAGITGIPKGITIPPAIIPPMLLDYENWNEALYEKLPDYLQTAIKSSLEYAALKNPNARQIDEHPEHLPDNPNDDDLPF